MTSKGPIVLGSSFDIAGSNLPRPPALEPLSWQFKRDHMVLTTAVGRKISSGTVLHRRRNGHLEVLLVHPNGAVHATTPWGIPKGYPKSGETLEDAARRETWEETGIVPRTLRPLGFVNYKRTHKRVHAFAGDAPDGEPRCASHEVDAAAFVRLDEARRAIHPDQRPLLDRLEAVLWKVSGDRPTADSNPPPTENQ